MLDAFPRSGRVEWLGVRPGVHRPVVALEEVEAVPGDGLVGDRYRSRRVGAGTRQVTLLQAEHLPVIAALADLEVVTPEALRRNVVVSGINLQALKGRRVAVGDAVLTVVSPCDPCSQMEEGLGPGAYNAMRGHGGWNARVLEGGPIRLGDAVTELGRLE